MPLDVERMIADPGTLFQPMDPKYEIFYPLPSPETFDAVNFAVCATISGFFAGEGVQRDDMPGGTIYYIPFRTWIVQLIVYRVAGVKACIRLRHCVPIGDRDGYFRDYARRPRPKAGYEVGISALMNEIHDEVSLCIHYACTLGKETAPPPPPASNLYAIFQWQHLYRPAMTDRELADLVGLSYQTIRNARSKHRQVKREVHQLEYQPHPRKKTHHVKTQRGRPKKK